MTLRSECVIWQGALTVKGYGIAGRTSAHRAAWTAANGPIPEGLEVDHICFARACVNLEHLRLLTVTENRRLQRSALRTQCVNGHDLTPENTYYRRPTPRGGNRDCKACHRERQQRYVARQRGIAA